MTQATQTTTRKSRHTPQIAALCFAMLASPVAAQTLPDSTTLFDQFTTRCAAIMADPEAALTAAVGSDTGSGAVTSDKALLSYQEAMPMPDGINAILFYSRVQTALGREEACNLTMTDLAGGDQALNLTDMPDIVATRAEALLGGPVTRVGGPFMQQGEIGQIYLYSAGDGFPTPRTFYVMQALGFLTLSHTIRTPN
ncbi:MAG: hypothetical protein ACRC6I_06960 [Paracoccaceae bacterium]